MNYMQSVAGYVLTSTSVYCTCLTVMFLWHSP